MRSATQRKLRFESSYASISRSLNRGDDFSFTVGISSKFNLVRHRMRPVSVSESSACT